jgi:hypothetical protein
MSTLKRRTPLVRRPKAKGNRYEKVVRDQLREAGYVNTKRNLQSGGQGGGDLIESIPGYSIECKAQERLNIWKALEQAENAGKPTDTPLVIFKRNRSISYACLPLEDFLALVEAASL